MLRSRADHGVDMAAAITEDNDKGRAYECFSVRWRAAAISRADMFHPRYGASGTSRFSIAVFLGFVSRTQSTIAGVLFPGFRLLHWVGQMLVRLRDQPELFLGFAIPGMPVRVV